jgi:hypothetical protein
VFSAWPMLKSYLDNWRYSSFESKGSGQRKLKNLRF